MKLAVPTCSGRAGRRMGRTAMLMQVPAEAWHVSLRQGTKDFKSGEAASSREPLALVHQKADDSPEFVKITRRPSEASTLKLGFITPCLGRAASADKNRSKH